MVFPISLKSGDNMALAKFVWKANRAWQDGIQYNTLITQYESGKEQRRSKGLARRTFSLQFEKATTTNSDAQEIWDFFMARRGRLEPFLWDYKKSDGSIEEVAVRFDMDALNRETFMNIIYSFGITLIEVI